MADWKVLGETRKNGKQPMTLLKPFVPRRHSASVVILGIIAALALWLVWLRIVMLWPDLSHQTAVQRSETVLAGIFQDLVLCMIVGAVAFGAQATWPRFSQKINWTALVISSLIASYAVANLEVVKILGGPVTVDWLRYSDLLSYGSLSIDALNAVFYLLTGNLLLILLAAPLIFLAATAICTLLLSRLAKAAPVVAVSIACPTILALLYAGATAAPGLAQGKLSNPVLAFVGSMLPGADPIPTFAEAHDATAILDVQKQRLESSSTTPKGDTSAIQNIVLFVLESVPAKIVFNTHLVSSVMPNLYGSSSNALRFDNIYAHAPATNYSLVSMLTSVTPELSSVGMTEKYPDFPVKSIADVLSARGFRTAYFNSSDSRFQNSHVFLANKGFDRVEDFRDWSCEKVYENSSETWRYMDFASDMCTVDRLNSWIAEQPAKPFFAVLWTGLTHYPYFPEGESKSFDTMNEDRNRYLNALHASDQAFGALIAFLSAQALARNTLVVVVGDHGEAFGEHGTFVHASGIYEENV